MKWMLIIIVVGIVFAVIFSLKAAPTLSEDAAREKLNNGAVVVDVRTIHEFQGEHLTNAINIPLDQIKELLPKKVPDKSRVILLHCRSGHRSGIAEKEFRALGYTNAFNIGSYGRAEKIVGKRH